MRPQTAAPIGVAGTGLDSLAFWVKGLHRQTMPAVIFDECDEACNNCEFPKPCIHIQCFQLSPSIFLFPYVRKVFDLPKFTDLTTLHHIASCRTPFPSPPSLPSSPYHSLLIPPGSSLHLFIVKATVFSLPLCLQVVELGIQKFCRCKIYWLTVRPVFKI